MAAAKVFEIGRVAYTSQITGVKSISFDDVGGNMTTFFADGDVYSRVIYWDSLTPTIQILTTDLSLAYTYPIGSSDTLTVQMPQKAAGIGGFEAGSTALQNAMTLAILTSRPPQATQQGESALNMSFTGITVDGVTSPVTLSLTSATAIG